MSKATIVKQELVGNVITVKLNDENVKCSYKHTNEYGSDIYHGEATDDKCNQTFITYYDKKAKAPSLTPEQKAHIKAIDKLPISDTDKESLIKAILAR